MSTVPVKPLPPLGLHPIRRNPTSTTTLKSQTMLTTVSSKLFLGFSTYNRCFEFKSWSQMRNPASLSHRRRVSTVVASAGNMTAPSPWESWMPDKKAVATTLLLSDVIWPAAGAFAAMAIMGRMDQMLSPKGISMSVAPLGAVCAILFTTPSAPAARMFLCRATLETGASKTGVQASPLSHLGGSSCLDKPKGSPLSSYSSQAYSSGSAL